MSSLLADNSLLAIFLVLALGAVLGSIKFGPIKLGAAGALFIGLAIGAAVPDVADSMQLVQSLGLALFVYTVGLAAGVTFFRDIRRQVGLFVVTAVILVVIAGIVTLISHMIGLDMDYTLGAYAGSLTSTPTLAAATDAAKNALPGVGYAIGYPIGVIVTIIAISLVVERKWPGKKDTPSLAGMGLQVHTIAVEHDIPLRQVPGWNEGKVRMSYLSRNGHMHVVSPAERLLNGDLVTLVSLPGSAEEAIVALGHETHDIRLDTHRDEVDYRFFLVSRKTLMGHTIGEISSTVASRFGGVIMRVRRGDLEMLAADDFVVQPGDRLLVVAHHNELTEIASFFGDSMRAISEVDPLGFGLGMTLGMLAGLISFPLPGGAVFTLGMACGPLIVGMILGALHRTGPVVWALPETANLTLRQLGLELFLVTVGLASGHAFAENAFSLTGAKIALIAVIVVGLSAVCLLFAGRFLGLSAQRMAGALAGYVGQPAILAFALDKVRDERIEAGYAALFAYAVIIKILCVEVIAAL